MTHYLTQKTWRLWDQSVSGLTQSPLESFAADDTLCHLVGQGMSAPTIRTWVHDSSVVLGIQDHRLPFVHAGMDLLEERGYKPIVRNSGGLAVVLDPGILNISIVLSEEQGKIDINSGYDVMVELIKALFPQAADRIEAYEIVGSYCPGSYDLSIDGKKFAGISQRRLRQGIAVQIYLSIEGSGAERAKLIRDFYEVALQNEQTKFQYPKVKPEVMASLSELLEEELTVSQTVQNLQKFLYEHSDELLMGGLQQDELEQYGFYLQRVFERNQKMLAPVEG
ncbi:octanoyl-[GcvH]:protein N-octanoyltransferase [Kurthia zopfii]|uniref:Octanoyl-[GcvH]:protein N-octanoyltransferase n=1 Tax=Kurthia zopfii TaxID=1650 RepID=A0A2U3A9I1_9BACL|nr:lipoate--protein ligase family protein [Kurthia zopfii]PWI21160.1 octanoyltransferase [Kurthia zopfii]TDR33285.1 octanoyl-[GcvH]:protein N-octanoyltransferase [Kurthia zopfii]STX08626.1 Octanoyl-[GcvH]:protein N-octanoyltransferase [Kurthia zopfii]VEI05168.1 Octanoyl-[GcvH]:protein N-octanoyltransferase [Kurthia zopfii]GEK32174.1 octanoyl-[GcvH]:protein N-octanoyltransferase [Kurthia zopfii]